MNINVTVLVEECDSNDRRMNAYMAGIETTNTDSGDEDEEDSPKPRRRVRARKVSY